MALSSDLSPVTFANGGPTGYRRPASGTVAAGKVLYLGGINLEIDGVARPAVSGTALEALSGNFAGANDNGGIWVNARRRGVRLTLTGGTSQTLRVVSITRGATIDIVIGLDTDNANAVTTTGLALELFLLGHAEISRLLRVKRKGNGSAICAVATQTAVPCVAVLGVPTERFGDAGSGSAQTCPASLAFAVGEMHIATTSGAAPVAGSVAYLIDDNTISGTADALAPVVPVRAIQGGRYVVALQEAN